MSEIYTTVEDILLSLDRALTIYPAILAGLNETAAQDWREGPREWSVVEILCHLRDAEANALERCRRMVEEEMPRLQSWDPEELAKEKDYRSESFQGAIKAFLTSRRETLTYLKGLTREQWACGAIHSSMGELTILSYMTHMAAHDWDHAAQIIRTISTG
jgi:hypothetical protein